MEAVGSCKVGWMAAGVAGYTVAILAEGAVPRIAGGFGYAAAIPLGIAAAILMGLLVGAVSVRTRDIYLLMITLALAMGVFRFVETNIAFDLHVRRFDVPTGLDRCVDDLEDPLARRASGLHQLVELM